MPLPVAVWYIGGGVLALLGVGATAEIIHKRNVAKALSAGTSAGAAAAAAGGAGAANGAAPASAPTAVTPAAQAAAVSPAAQAGLANSGVSPAQLDAAAASVGANVSDVIAAQIAANPGSDPGDVAAFVAQQLVAQAAAAAADPNIQIGINPTTVQQAMVSTNDPAPQGDLIIRSGPSLNSPQVGGAEKGGLVTVLDSGAVNADFTKVSWPGGNRLPAADGFAHTSALQLI